jgi:superfamily II DNA or RNA helicase
MMVMLGLETPEDEVVMLKPTRNVRNLWADVTDAQRTQAVEAARGRTLTVDSPLLGRGTVRFAGRWTWDGVAWAERAAEGVVVELPVVQAPDWAADPMIDDSALRSALAAEGAGIVQDAEAQVARLVEGVPSAVLLRAISLLRQQWVRVAMPTPALSGGQASDQMVAYPGDWSVWRLLVLLSRLVPSALRPRQLPSFDIPDARVLRRLEAWLVRAVRGGAAVANAPAGAGQWQGPLWAEFGHTVFDRLMPHQRSAVERMRERDEAADTGHFLVLDTGVGKTVTALAYAHQWLIRHPAVRRILWVTPKGTTEGLCQQLRAQWGVPVHMVPRVSAAKKPKRGETRRLELVDYRVNVLHADHMRMSIEELTEYARSSFIVFDEVDELYAATLRTSAAQSIAALTPKFVCQTATPMRKDEAQLVPWLAATSPFPVDRANMLVAASAMVQMQLELGIEGVEETVAVAMDDDVRVASRKLARARDWHGMARAVQRATDAAMVETAVREARADRAAHQDGGVLLVADSLAHADRLTTLVQACADLRVGDFASMSAPDAGTYAVVVITKQHDRGYNCAVRLGVLVTGAYASNSASRHQLRGRIRRIGQRRPIVRFVTVVMRSTVLEVLHARHSAVDDLNASLEQLAERFALEAGWLE